MEKMTPKEKEPGRKQRRFMDRLNKEIAATHSRLCDNFLDFMIETEDVTKEQAEAKINDLHRKWITYCHAKHVKPEFKDIVKDYCLKTVQQFFTEEEIKIVKE